MSTHRRNRFAPAIEAILRNAARATAALLVLAATRGSAQTPSAPPAGTPAVALRLPADRVYTRSVGPDSAVTFRHATHVEYESGRCTGCHPRLYRILGPTPAFTHRDMNDGGSCGTCHDGKHAFDVRAKESCRSCHAGRQAVSAARSDSAGAPAAFTGPKPFAFKRSNASPGAVTFRHETHGTKAKLACSACHSKLFAMKPLVQDPNADWHERARCGACHDGRQSFNVEDDAACERCHREGKGTP